MYVYHDRSKFEAINMINDPRDKNVIVTIEGLLSLRGYWKNGVFCNDDDDDNENNNDDSDITAISIRNTQTSKGYISTNNNDTVII